PLKPRRQKTASPPKSSLKISTSADLPCSAPPQKISKALPSFAIQQTTTASSPNSKRTGKLRSPPASNSLAKFLRQLPVTTASSPWNSNACPPAAVESNSPQNQFFPVACILLSASSRNCATEKIRTSPPRSTFRREKQRTGSPRPNNFK